MANRQTPYLAPERADFDSMLAALRAGDEASVAQMAGAGKVIAIELGTTAFVSETFKGVRLVMIGGGKHEGAEGYIEERFLRRDRGAELAEEGRRQRAEEASKRQRHRASVAAAGRPKAPALTEDDDGPSGGGTSAGYGSVHTGPRGGVYHYSASGKKVYHKKK